MAGGRARATGPGDRPVLAVYAGRPGGVRIHSLRVRGAAAVGGDTIPLAGWNRARPRGLALFDDGWGARTDTATGTVEVVLGSGARAPVLAVDTAPAGVQLPVGGRVLTLGAAAAPGARARLLALAPA